MIRFTWGLALAVVCFSIVLAQAEPRGGERSRDEGRDNEGRDGNQDRFRDGNQERGRDSLQNQHGDNRTNFGRTEGFDATHNNLRSNNLPGRGFENARGIENGPGAGQWNRFQGTPTDGAALGAAAANRNQPFYPLNGAAMYNPAWYAAHPAAWAPAAWAVNSVWQPVDWITIASACGYVGVAPAYNGGNLSSDQAAELAANGADANASRNDEWLPLGVFALVRDNQQQPQFVLQLAINRQGVLRGNSTDAAGDRTLPIQGAVDRKTLTAAWSIGNDTQTVLEAGLPDLARGEAQAVLYRNGATENWLLVRMTQP